MAVTVRDLGVDDVDALQELLETVPDYAERITGYPPGPSDGLSALLSVPEGFDPDGPGAVGKYGIGLWDDSELLAFADLLIGYPSASFAFIGLLIVRGDRQQEGLGAVMHDAVVERARSAPGVARLRLGIVATNTAVAEPFWRALGYEPTGERKPYRYDHLESAVALWERPL
ncbi:acetyltransferase (GNAT) family protein [Curtobacterium flaccumfaciens]|uniref:Acetyltransferase (GNAT) family protein n=1 Tax=Curtobacterium flaccumfaciens TaxID=2035 RepID=A0A4R6DD54_9MICO|nr:GNAT family N-acetyltransferase [Curtobacterium flaccumfaciens]TDN42300.1 acetyltransferase (GNAT) family protein [Curtobacterium flaccumfaciens]